MKGTYGLVGRSCLAEPPPRLSEHGSDGSDPSPSWLVTFSREADTAPTAAHPARGFPRVQQSAMGADDPPPNAEAEAAEDAAVPPPPPRTVSATASVRRWRARQVPLPRVFDRDVQPGVLQAAQIRGRGCTGKRDRTAFKDIRDFTDADVVSDYRFLEEALLEKDRAKRWRPEFAAGSDAAARADRAPAAAKNHRPPHPTGARQGRRTLLHARRHGAPSREYHLLRPKARPHAVARRVALPRRRARPRPLPPQPPRRQRRGSSRERRMPNSTRTSRSATPSARTSCLALAAPRVCTSFAVSSPRRNPTRRLSWRCFSPRRGNPQTTGGFHRLRTEETIRANLAGKRLVEFPTLHVAVLPEDEGTFPEMEETKSDAAGVAGLEDGAEREAGENPDSG